MAKTTILFSALLFTTLLGSPSCVARVATGEGIASQYARDQSIKKDPSVIYATGFERGIREPLDITRKGVVALKTPGIAHRGQRCAQITATKNVDEGGDLKIKWDQGVEECFMRVYVRFDKDTLMPHHFINLRGQTPTYKYRWGGARDYALRAARMVPSAPHWNHPRARKAVGNSIRIGMKCVVGKRHTVQKMDVPTLITAVSHLRQSRRLPL